LLDNVANRLQRSAISGYFGFVPERRRLIDDLAAALGMVVVPASTFQSHGKANVTRRNFCWRGACEQLYCMADDNDPKSRGLAP
jgi:hypothetical protein